MVRNLRFQFFFGFVLLFVIALPVSAQKNILPLVRAATTKTAAAGTVGSIAVSSELPSQMLVHADRALIQAPAEQFEYVKKIRRELFENDKTILQLVKEQLRQKHLKDVPVYMPWRNLDFEIDPSSIDPSVLQEFQTTLQQIEAFGAAHLYLYPLNSAPSTLNPLKAFSPFAAKNNKILLFHLQNLLKKLEYLQTNAAQVRSSLTTISSGKLMLQLAKKIQNESLIFLGETHYLRETQHAVGELIVQLKKQQPKRRVVLFTEFLDLPNHNPPFINQPLETYFLEIDPSAVHKLSAQETKQKMYAQAMFQRVVAHNVEVYPLEDRYQNDLIAASKGTGNSMLGVILRNKSWARIMKQKMDEIRKTDPDALFIVYAGMGHTSWIKPASLPKFFENEKPVVVEFNFSKNLNRNLLYLLWGKTVPFFPKKNKTSLSFWTGEDNQQFVRNSGFDYLVVLAQSWSANLHRKYTSFVFSD